MSEKQTITPELDLEIRRRLMSARFATYEVGRLTWDYFEKGVATEVKSDNTPVTVADREGEEVLRAVFDKEFPGDGYLGEEFGEQPSTTGFRWVIDPIDATKNFVRGVPFWANLIGLEYEGEVVAGVANIPGLNQMYYASVGHGAFCNERRLQVNDVEELSDAHMIYSSVDWFEKHGKTDFFMDMIRTVPRTRGFGDFFGFLFVASGAADFVLETEISPWDVAPLKIIVEEAGGIFTDWQNKPTIYGEGCIAANPTLHKKIMAKLGF